MNRYINKIDKLVDGMEMSKPKAKGKGLLAPKETTMAKKEEPRNDTDLVTRVVYALRQQRKGLNNGSKTQG